MSQAINLNDPAAVLRQGSALLAEDAVEAALPLLEAGVARFPEEPGLVGRLADALQMAGRGAEAEPLYRRAIALDPGPFEPWYGLGHLYIARWSYGAAEVPLREALARRPGDARAGLALAEVLFQTGRVEQAVATYRRHYGGGGALDRIAFDNLATIIPGSPEADHAQVLAVRKGWAGSLPRRPAPAPPAREAGKIRLGYVSSFFGGANWMKPVFGVLNRHDRERFELHLIADGEAPSEVGGFRGQAADAVWKVRGLGNAALAEKIVEAGIDVLVDLNGWSRPARLGLFALRPAPVQLGWFNMFATTGVSGFDALVGDAAVIPAAEERFYGERILRVPGSYLAFEVGYPVPEVAPPPCLAAGHLTFGSLCSAIKITDAVVSAWAAILRGAPGARLLLRFGTLEDASNQAALRARFAREGVEAERLILLGRAEHQEFLSTYGQVDVALDTFPYNGGTTTTEALWQGVPVLSFNGDRWASRTSRSLLLAAGLAEWCVESREAYVARAIALAGDAGTPARLAALRAGMRERLRASAVCDVAGLCAALEGIYAAELAARAG